MGKRGPRRQISEEQLLDAALVVVTAEGLAGLSMSALARELEVSVSGLYRYVDDLGDLFFRLQRRALDRYEAGLLAHLAAVEASLAIGSAKTPSPDDQGPAGPRVRSLVRAVEAFLYFLHHRHAHPSEHHLLDAFLSDPAPVLSLEAAAAVGSQVDSILRQCGEPLDQARSAGAIAPGDTAVQTHLVWAALHGLMHFEKRDRIQPPHLAAEALVPPLVRSLLIGFGARPSDVDQALQLQQTLRLNPPPDAAT